MKFVCNKCDRLVDEKDVIILFEPATLVATSAISAFCSECWKKVKEAS